MSLPWTPGSVVTNWDVGLDGGVGMIRASKLCNMGMCVARAGMLCLIGSAWLGRGETRFLFFAHTPSLLFGFCGVLDFMIVYFLLLLGRLPLFFLFLVFCRVWY